MPTARLALIGISAAAALAACSLVLDFGDEGLPCDSSGACLAGFTCSAGKCVRSGPTEPCGGCGPGRRCDLVANTCVQDVCATRLCPVAYGCTTAGDHTRCDPLVPPALGMACEVDSDCAAGGAGRVCLKGSVPTSSGFLRTGTCVEPCGPGGACAGGGTCQSFALGFDAGVARLCATEGLLHGCSGEADCRAQALTCAVFDHPAIGPLSLCDAPLADGGLSQGACVKGSASRDGGSLCANGLCVPEISGAAPPRCTEVCSQGCGAGESCRLVEYGVAAGFPVRQVPMCIPEITACRDCRAGGQVCGGDAPRCTGLDAGRYCLAACTPGSADAGSGLECAPGFSCQVVAEGARCVPVSGACP